MPINGKLKRLRANTVLDNIISNACSTILKEQAIKAVNKKLRIKDKNSENTKLQ